MFKYVAVAKVLKKHKPSIDNMVFRLHYRVTFLIFCISSTLVMAKEFFGSPIQCYTKGSVPGDIMNIYCYIMSTFSVPRHYPKPLGDGVDQAFMGLGTHGVDDDLVYHAYYQWVPLMLFFQALMFYVPRFIHKQAEGGLFSVVLCGMDKPETSSDKRHKQHQELSKYMINNLNMHTFWAFRFFLCEVISFVIVVGNIYFTDYFLGGTFLKYGIEAVNFVDMSDEDRVDPMVRIFPTVSKCNFRATGASGTVELNDAMCVLAVNIFNQKVYILLWFWLVFLAVLTGGWLLFRIATIVFPPLRGYLLQYRGRMAGKEHVTRIQKACNLGDWFLLYQLGRAIEPGTYGEFLRELAQELENLPPKRDELRAMLPAS